MVNREPLWTPLTDTQARVFAESRRRFDLYRTALRRTLDFPGWMFWKKYPNGRTYLVHAYDRTGKGTTLGAMSPENEAKLLTFKTQQADAKLRLKMAKDRVAEQARFCKAARINRVPKLVANIGRAIEENASIGQCFVTDTCALYVYEGLYGVQFPTSTLDAARLALALCLADPKPTDYASPDTLAAVATVLRSIDRSFNESSGLINNSAGFNVAIAPTPSAMGSNSWPNRDKRTNPDPRMEMGQIAIVAAVVIDHDGWPLEMRAPDPRIFAAVNRWQANQDNLSAEERNRYRVQSDTVAALVRTHPVALQALPMASDLPDSGSLGSLLRELELT